MDILPYIEKLRKHAEDAISSLPALMLKSEKIAENILHGEHARHKSGIGEKFWQFREYNPFDRPEDIDWRQSAKGDQVFTKQKEWHVTRKIFFWCAGGDSMNFTSRKSLYSKQENAQILCLSLALLLRKNYEQIGVYEQKQTGRSEKTLQNLAQYLFDRSLVNESLPDTSKLTHPQHAIFIGVGDFLAPIEDLKHRFEALSQQSQNALIIQVLDPAELELNYSGRICFHNANPNQHSKQNSNQNLDPDNTRNITINSVASVRKEYIERINEHLSCVKALCETHGWHYILHRTDQDISNSIRVIWELVDVGGIRK